MLLRAEPHVPVEGRVGSGAHSEAGAGCRGGAAAVGDRGEPDWRCMACCRTRPCICRAMTCEGHLDDSFGHNPKEIHMKYRLLGNCGLRVSEAALGTMTFGDDWGWGAAKDEARKVYDAFREAGGNFIDTANFYTNGTSESFLGEFMEGHRYKHKLLAMIDEFPALGKLEILQESLAFVAGYGIKCYLISQDINQLKSRETGYGPDETITSNCHVQCAFPPNRLETAKNLSKLTGQPTIIKEQITRSGRGWGTQVSTTMQEVQRPLLT